MRRPGGGCGARGAAALAAHARAKFAAVYRRADSAARATSVTHGATIPLHVRAGQLDALPATRRELLAVVGSHPELSAEMASADTWRACGGGGGGASGPGLLGAAEAPPPPRAPGTLAAFGSLMAAAEGAQHDP